MKATLEAALPQPPSWRAVGGDRSSVSNLIHDGVFVIGVALHISMYGSEGCNSWQGNRHSHLREEIAMPAMGCCWLLLICSVCATVRPWTFSWSLDSMASLLGAIVVRGCWVNTSRLDNAAYLMMYDIA